MKIGVFNDFFYPKITGGTELFLKELCKYLEENGFDITLFVSNQVKGETGYKTYKIKSSPFLYKHMQQIPGVTLPWLAFNNSLKEKLKKIIKKEDIDAAYLNNIYHLSFAPIQAALELKKPTILDAHDYWPICFAKDKYKDNKKLCRQKENWRCSLCLMRKFGFPSPLTIPKLYIEKIIKMSLIKKADKIIVHSNFVKERFKENELNPEVIYYPFFGKIEKKAKKDDDVFRILFVGRVDKHKGADLLINVANYLKGVRENFRIDVIGTGLLNEFLDRKDLNIYTHGFMREERFEYFKKADCFLAPSRWPEPFGIVALEAMAYELPVLVLDKSAGLVETVKKNKAGIVSTEEKIGENVIKLKENLQKFRKNCRKGIKNYDKQYVFKKYKKIFETI